MSLTTSRLTHAQVALQSSNAAIRGEFSKLLHLPLSLRGLACEIDTCSQPIQPIHLSLSIKGYSSVQLVFNQASKTEFVRRDIRYQTEDELAERPILLQGVGIHRHAGRNGTSARFPVAGTLYFDDGVTELEISTTHLNRRDRSQILVARIPLTAFSPGHAMWGYAPRISSYAFPEARCGTSSGAVNAHQGAFEPLSTSISRQNAPKVLYIGTHFDSQFMKAARCKTASRCNNKIISLINKAAVYYRRQLRIDLRVVQQHGPVDLTGSTQRSSDMFDYYQAVISSRHSSDVHDGVNGGSALVDGFVGFTGKRMRGNVMGIANLGVYCDDAKATSSLSLVRHIVDALTVPALAHELGHNLSAEHTSSGIMFPSTSRFRKNLKFAPESVSEISSYTDAWYGECRGGESNGAPPGTGEYAPKVDLTVSSSPETNFVLSLSLQNPRSNCSVIVRASETVEDINSGVVILERTMGNSSLKRAQSISTTIDTSNPEEATVYFQASYVCSGNRIRSQSAISAYVAPHDTSNPYRVSRSSWINYLRMNLA